MQRSISEDERHSANLKRWPRVGGPAGQGPGAPGVKRSAALLLGNSPRERIAQSLVDALPPENRHPGTRLVTHSAKDHHASAGGNELGKPVESLEPVSGHCLSRLYFDGKDLFRRMLDHQIDFVAVRIAPEIQLACQ